MLEFPSVLRSNGILLCVHTTFGSSIHLDCFSLLPVESNVTMSVSSRISLPDPALEWNYGPHGNSIFNFLRKHHDIFYSGYIILYSYRNVSLNCSRKDRNKILCWVLQSEWCLIEKHNLICHLFLFSRCLVHSGGSVRYGEWVNEPSGAWWPVLSPSFTFFIQLPCVLQEWPGEQPEHLVMDYCLLLGCLSWSLVRLWKTF